MKISDFQNLMRELYFHRDSERGINRTFIWLVEEIGELANLIKYEKIEKKHISEEIADIIAWTNSLANLLDINIEKALSEKYPKRGLKCNSSPCQCYL